VTATVTTPAGALGPGGAPDLRATGERIEVLLEAASAGGRVARERAEELVRLVVDLYGAGLERLLEIVHDAGRLDDALLDRLTADDLVGGLLAVHGLHPDDVATRVARALDSVRPYLGSHGGDVELVGLTEDGVVRLRMLGSCDGCPSSSVTLTLAVETAIQAAAPEVSGIAIEEAAPAPGHGAVIPVTALRARLDEAGRPPGRLPGIPGDWTTVEALGSLPPGQPAAVDVAGIPVVCVRIGAEWFAYRDGCPVCGGSLADGVLGRRLGGRAADAVLRCPTCSAHFDVRRAGRGLDGTDDHLEPVPLLVTGDGIALAVPGAVSA
jgi:Fe-S cluster biogenesis protein NfuA/nitrite reductase/ring-hydroxylating ferredoxin subunit